MKHLTAFAIAELSWLRSTVLVGLALISTSVSLRCWTPTATPLRLETPQQSGEPSVEWTDFGVERVDAAQLPVGAHLVSPRRFYLHHGIYLGAGEVAHYSGFSSALRAGPVEVTDLDGFASGKPVWRLLEPGEYASEEIARRARSRLGENRYRVLSNNCEHFCNWCVSGRSSSAQVRACLHRPTDLFALIHALQPQLIA